MPKPAAAESSRSVESLRDYLRLRVGNYSPSLARDSIANMRLLDAIRAAAGLS